MISPYLLHWNVLNFDHIQLTLAVQWDNLAKIMSLFILVIGFIIFNFARTYLESDATRTRFLLQFNLVLASVLLLVVAANLLTAFVAWQLIGINLYLILNHYHTDAAANRAAKKKFVINRIGDCCFILAIIIAYQTGSEASFASIHTSEHVGLICSLLFISVMTKCAQFPFHLWLIDTMETPTPVSALMHAGVINAGGVLLARLSDSIIGLHYLTYFILLVGLLSMALSIQWMNQQPDTKKKLAYSTMGQMGYMLTQCSLGAFPAAIFHLMSHGFYKASLFLNAGETLGDVESKQNTPIAYSALLKSMVIGTVIFIAGVWLMRHQALHMPLLMNGFILITLITLVLKVPSFNKSPLHIQLIHYGIISVMYFAYLYGLNYFETLLPHIEKPVTLPNLTQAILVTLLFLAQVYLWRCPATHITLAVRDTTEVYLRRWILNPIRSLGELVNRQSIKPAEPYIYSIMLILMVMILILGGSRSALTQWASTESDLLIFICLAVGIMALIIANRCSSILSLLRYLVVFEIAFINLAWFDNDGLTHKIGLFHAINISAVTLMLASLARHQNNEQPAQTELTNKLPTRLFYLTFNLLLLIGIPGTASFISEFYLLNSLMNGHFLLVLMYFCQIMLMAIVIMHSLQLYVFKSNGAILLSSPISKAQHGLFLLVIGLNLFCGIYPSLLLSHL